MIAAIDYNVCLNRNGYINRNGLRQVVIELSQQGHRRIVNTHIHVTPDDFAFGRVQPTNENHDLLNRRIRRIVRRLMELEDEMLDAGMEPSPERILYAFRHHLTNSATISEWVNSVIEPSDRRASTKESYRTLRRSLEAFSPNLRIGELTYDLIQRWQNWMHDKKLCENTIANRLKTLRCLVNEAIKRDVIRADLDPFRHIRIPEITARQEHLSNQELEALERVSLNKRLGHIRDAFLFCCYTGLRWGDFTRLTSENLFPSAGIADSSSPLDTDISLVLRQHKTGIPLRIPIGALWQGKALRIIGKYGSVERLTRISDNKYANKLLREVAEKAGISKHLHWHLARHTCGTLLNQRGLRMQEIQYILGHRKQSTTERHYAETLYDQVAQSVTNAFKQPSRKIPHAQRS